MWDDPKTGHPIMLIMNETLYFGDKLPHSLINPNQLRANGLKVEDCPKQFDRTSSHSIFVPDEDLTIPLQLSGVISRFHTYKPSKSDLNDPDIPRTHLTSDIEWDPNSPSFAQTEGRVQTVSSLRTTKVTAADVNHSIHRRISAARVFRDATNDSVRIYGQEEIVGKPAGKENEEPRLYYRGFK